GSGGWGYIPGEAMQSSPDHSLNHYILLGVHEARVAGFEVDREGDRKGLEEMYDHYNGHTPGAWGYRGRPASLTMPTAGLGNVRITGQDLNRDQVGTRSFASNSGSSSNLGQRRSIRAIGSRLMRAMKAWQAAIKSGTLWWQKPRVTSSRIQSHRRSMGLRSGL